MTAGWRKRLELVTANTRMMGGRRSTAKVSRRQRKKKSPAETLRLSRNRVMHHTRLEINL